MTELVASAEFSVRPATDDDLNYVRKTWLRAFADEALPPADLLFGDDFMREHPSLRDAAIERGAVSIAYRPSTPTGICGFAVTEQHVANVGTDRHPAVFVGEPVIHFVYVKPMWRRLGAARLLLRPLLARPALFTHRTKMLALLPVPESWRFNPYPFFRGST